jgi:hypothetical protein
MTKSGVRGKYARRKRKEGTSLVLTDAGLRKLFPDSASMNPALRDYVEHRSGPTS